MAVAPAFSRFRRALSAFLALLLLSSVALARPPRKFGIPKPKGILFGGAHYRFTTEHGPVHVWRPQHYDRRSAGTVVYLHGFYTNADDAFRDHRLAEQFKNGGQNALYIVPESPAGGHDPTPWPRLDELLTTVATRLGAPLPGGPLVVMGHSGAYRVIAGWLGTPRLEHVILVDALYGNEEEFGAWIDAPIGDGPKALIRRLTLVAQGTRKWAEPFIKSRPRAIISNSIPARYEDFTKRQRTARLLYVRAQYGHMELITEGRTLPVLLRLTPLRRVKG